MAITPCQVDIDILRIYDFFPEVDLTKLVNQMRLKGKNLIVFLRKIPSKIHLSFSILKGSQIGLDQFCSLLIYLPICVSASKERSDLLRS